MEEITKNTITQGSEGSFEQISAQQSSLGGLCSVPCLPVFRGTSRCIVNLSEGPPLSPISRLTTRCPLVFRRTSRCRCTSRSFGTSRCRCAAPLGNQPHLAVSSGGPHHPSVASLFWRISQWPAAPIGAPGFSAQSRSPLVTR